MTQVASRRIRRCPTRSRRTLGCPTRDVYRVRVHACMRDDAVAAAIEQGFRSGARLGANPDGRAIVGWQKCFADGSLGSRTAALLDDIEPEPDRPLPPDLRRGVWMTDPEALRVRVERASAGGIATTIHAIGDAAVRAALDVLTPFAATSPLMPRIEHVQMLHPDDRPRFAAAGIAASVQPVHLGSDAIQAWKLWGDRAEAEGYTWKAIADTGAVMAFGTDAPVESYDPWPGLALAVRREDARWPAGTPAFAPDQALTLERALRAQCIDGPVSARELDRGRLTVGQRADVVVIPAASLDEPRDPRRSAVDDAPGHGADGREGRLRGLGRAVQLAERVCEQAVEDPRRRREGVDGVRQDVDRDVGLDRQHAFVDRRGCVGAGDGRADELA